MVPLRGLVILPGMLLHFDVKRNKSVKAVEDAMMDNQILFVSAQKKSAVDDPGLDDIYNVGCVCRIRQVTKMPNGVLRVLVEGLLRAFIKTEETLTGWENGDAKAFIEPIYDNTELSDDTSEAMKRELNDALDSYFKLFPKVARTYRFYQNQDMTEVSLEEMMDQLCGCLPLSIEKKQGLLEAGDVETRFFVLTGILTNEVNIAKIKNDFSAKVKAQVDKHQREYILREQLQFIKEELGENGSLKDADEFKKKTDALKAPKEVKEKLYKEISRYEAVMGSSSESAVIRGYIETVLELPWDKVSKDRQDIKQAEDILNRDHYGLEKVKERILELLAVRALNKKGESPIICLVGPPGTGKTSIAKSIAESLNKKYVRISLGGVRDEAEIRGHRKTYVGAMPGRIINGLKQAKVGNPLMLLDEVDKLSSDYKGDTASALLEVLDPEQNKAFVDHYIELPVDLSRVLFIATANSTETIPRPLLDRMELIEVSGYTSNEKMHIAKDHLIKKVFEKNGIEDGQIKIADTALEDVILHYTREAGVRQLERRLSELSRKSAKAILSGKKKISINRQNLESYLGKKKYNFDKTADKDDIGIVRGLAWTSVGGDTLEIEVNKMPGEGKLVLTGQMGDVMKESAQTGYSYIRSVQKQYGIKAETFKKNDIHIHIPEGAVPKDGPSAGITMATALLSALTDIPVRADIAMTGEITLRGRVLPIGGLKEKLLAAKLAGVKKVLVPKKNTKDVEEISAEIKSGLNIVFVETMDEVLKHALVRKEAEL